MISRIVEQAQRKAKRHGRHYLSALLVILLAVAVAAPAPVQATETHKSSAHKASSHKKTAQSKTKKKKPKVVQTGPNRKYASLVMDASTGRILSADQPDKIVHPASLAKMMTLLVVFQAVDEGRATLRDQVHISSYAASMAPSRLGLKPGSSIRLEDAIYAVVTKSANDISVALAEHIGGTQGTFVSMMNRKAAQIGMKHTYFVNANGLHNPRQVTTARDMAQLARVLIYGYPKYYHYFATETFRYNKVRYANHNHLMETYDGMDGIKTGYIGPSGFNLVASARRGDRRVIGVVFGGLSAKSRDTHMASLLDRGFESLRTVAIASTAPAPGRKPEPQRADPASGDAARWAALAPMLQDKAVSRVVGTDEFDTRRDTVAIQSSQSIPQQKLQIIPSAYASETKQDWAIQIGAFSSRVKTDQALQAVLNALPPELRHGKPAIAPLQTASGWIFRGRLNGFTQDEATRACSRISDCLTVSPYAN